MKVILTGGAGFIGSCLLWKLNQKGISDILVVDHLGDSLKWRNLVGKDFRDYIEKDDFLKLVSEEKIDKDVDMIIHLGACTSTTCFDATYMMKNNYEYSRKLAKFAIKRKIPFLYASSAATYGAGEMGYSDEDAETLKLKPLNIYGYSKQLFDLWVLKNGLINKVTGFKFFNVFGPNEYHKGEMMSVIAKSFDKLLKEKKMKLFKSCREDYADGEQRRDFIYVKDAVDIVYHFIEHPKKTGIFNVGTGHAYTWNELAQAIFKALDMPARIEYFDMPEAIRDKYQYFTQADLNKLQGAGVNHNFSEFSEAVKDYAGYLKTHTHL
ncbi:MAG: ADP-glyceromanno-heptose 6-epimerase [Candidatus Omnitrophica bacterium]|nr:ADP-glyceromanno-heptose 6-epimerase [Candidatus Omnitrophota bacterium]